MSSTAIGMVSESLRNLLVGEMSLSPPVPVTILAPDESSNNRRINLFLYKVQENPAFKNMDWQVKRGSPDTLVPPPLSLNLFYLMTPYAPNDTVTGNATAHEILGEAMRVFSENPIVPDDYLVDGLQDAREQLQIIQNTLDMEELARLWSTFTQPFRLSVLYEVSVVQLDMLPASERPMPKRVLETGVDVRDLQPASGRPYCPLKRPSGDVDHRPRAAPGGLAGLCHGHGAQTLRRAGAHSGSIYGDVTGRSAAGFSRDQGRYLAPVQEDFFL